MKNVPPELHDELRRRAASEGKTVGEVILEALRRDMRQRTMHEWLDDLARRPRPDPAPTREQVDQIMSEARHDLWGDG